MGAGSEVPVPTASLGLRDVLATGEAGSLCLTSLVVWPSRFDLFFTISWRGGPRIGGSTLGHPMSRAFRVSVAEQHCSIVGSGLGGGRDAAFGRLHVLPSLPFGTAELEVSVDAPEWGLAGTGTVDVRQAWG